jgi:hypothetical protein
LTAWSIRRNAGLCELNMAYIGLGLIGAFFAIGGMTPSSTLRLRMIATGSAMTIAFIGCTAWFFRFEKGWMEIQNDLPPSLNQTQGCSVTGEPLTEGDLYDCH